MSSLSPLIPFPDLLDRAELDFHSLPKQHTELLSHQRGRGMTVSGVGFTQILCRYFVRNVTTQGLPGYQAVTVTAFVWDHCYNDTDQASFRCLLLLFVHGFIHRNEWERYSNTKYYDTGTASSAVFVGCVKCNPLEQLRLCVYSFFKNLF